MDNANIDKLIVIGDRVLVEPAVATHKTKGGLLLPAGYQEKEEIQTGYIVKCGPAIFMLKNAVELKYDGKKYFIVPQNGILMVEREEF